MKRLFVVFATLVAVAVIAGCGDDADDGGDDAAGEGGRTVELEMIDTEFRPARLRVTAGETVTFEFVNNGSVDHDAFVGDAAAQQEHEEEMRAGDEGHGHGDDEPAAVTVEAGERGRLTYTFDERGTVEIGCHQPGHYAAGMKVLVDVS